MSNSKDHSSVQHVVPQTQTLFVLKISVIDMIVGLRSDPCLIAPVIMLSLGYNFNVTYSTIIIGTISRDNVSPLSKTFSEPRDPVMTSLLGFYFLCGKMEKGGWIPPV
jgi:hypothetical protein